jgi:hypothetical protein
MDLKKHFLHVKNHGYFGINRRLDHFNDKDGNLYAGVIYILSCVWNGEKSEEDLIIQELEDGDLAGDLEFAIIEFTFSYVIDACIDRKTEDAMDLKFKDAKEDKTFLFKRWNEYEGLEELFAKDVRDYGQSLANQFDLRNIEVEIIEMFRKKFKNLI